jgi:hypothetical protein
MRGGMNRSWTLVVAFVVAFVGATLPAQPPPASPIATGTLVVRGRCVDFDTGAPLPRCRVRLTGHQSTGYPIAWSRADWADPPEVTTGPDGTFRFEVRLPAADEELDRGRYHLEISHAQHAALFSHCAFVIATAKGGVDYGDLRLPAGVRPRIRCEDTSGAPQPGVLLDLRRAKRSGADDGFTFGDGDGPIGWIESGAYARTDIDGYLHLDDPLPPGDFTLAVRGRDARAVPGTIKLPCAEPIVAVVAPLDAANSIRGRLVDDSGQPVEGAALSDGDDSSSSCVTRRDGAFTLVRVQPTKRATANLRLVLSGRYDGWMAMGTVEWGRGDVELLLPAKAPHTFVVRKADGTPVEDYNLYCSSSRSAGQVFRLAGTFAGGRAGCRLPPGDYDLLVVPRSDRVLASGWQAITIDAAHEEIAVAVPDAIARTVEVRFADDRSAAGNVLVEAIVGGEPAPFAWVLHNGSKSRSRAAGDARDGVGAHRRARQRDAVPSRARCAVRPRVRRRCAHHRERGRSRRRQAAGACHRTRRHIAGLHRTAGRAARARSRSRRRRGPFDLCLSQLVGPDADGCP